MIAFRLTAEQAEIFFTLCHELRADTEEKRVAILREMANHGQIDSVTKTKMTQQEYVQHLAKHFGNVLNITKKDNINGN